MGSGECKRGCCGSLTSVHESCSSTVLGLTPQIEGCTFPAGRKLRSPYPFADRARGCRKAASASCGSPQRLRRWVQPLLRLPEAHAPQVARSRTARAVPAASQLSGSSNPLLHGTRKRAPRKSRRAKTPGNLLPRAPYDPEPDDRLRPLPDIRSQHASRSPPAKAGPRPSA